MYRHILRKLSKNPDYVKNHSNDRNNPFYFANCKWMINQ